MNGTGGYNGNRSSVDGFDGLISGYNFSDFLGNLTVPPTDRSGPADNGGYGSHSVGTIVSLSLVYGLLSLTATVGNGIVIWIIRKLNFLYGFNKNSFANGLFHLDLDKTRHHLSKNRKKRKVCGPLKTIHF